MQVVLRRDVDGLGTKGDVVDVADGYARNYLVPRGLAMRATAGVVAQAASMTRARQVRDDRDRSAAEDVAKTLVPAVVHVSAKAGADGKLFGSVTAADVVDGVREQTGIEIDRKMLDLGDPIRSLGTHHVPARLHPDVQFPITIEVVEG